jgi:tripeptide aminopeptidase
MINEKRLINLFLELVQIDSPTGSEDKIAEFIFKYLKREKIKVEKDNFGNLIVKIAGNGSPIFLSAHLDTVEPGRGIKPVIEKGIIKSDGTTILGADNKDALSSILEVINVLSKTNLNHKPIDIALTKNEESDCIGAVKLNYKKIDAKEGFIFDAAKPIGTIITASPYYLRFDVEIIGKSAHASRPEMANNAILIFADAMKKIKLGKIDENTLANIGVINAGHVRNTIPGYMSLNGEIRSFKVGIVEKIAKQIVNEFEKSATKFGSKIKATVVLENPGYEYEDDDQIIKFAEDIFKENKIKPILERYHGCSDANIFSEKGLKILNLGNGSRNAHTVKEEISVNDLKTLSNLILSLVVS